MQFVDLRTGETHGANFVEEIGIEFFPVPSGFARDNAEKYAEASNQRETADAVMYDIEMQVESWVQEA